MDSDADILAALERGDSRSALRRLVDRYSKTIYSYCCEQLRDPVLADDVWQQVFIQAFRDMHHFKGRSSFRTWLLAIARHRILDATRAVRLRAARFVEVNMFAIPDPGPAPDVEVDDARLRQALVDCVRRIEEPTRTALLLRYQRGLTYAEMAEVLGVRENALQARVGRALHALRSHLNAKLEPAPDSQSEAAAVRPASSRRPR